MRKRQLITCLPHRYSSISLSLYHTPTHARISEAMQVQKHHNYTNHYKSERETANHLSPSLLAHIYIAPCTDRAWSGLISPLPFY